MPLPSCSDCGKQLANYASKKCNKHSKLGIPRPDMIGHTWNIGKGRRGTPMTEAAKRKQSELKKGKPLSAEHKAKIASSSKRGADHHNWRGGTQSKDHLERVKFRKTMQHKIFQRDNYTCQVCDVYGVPIQVDHIKRWADYPELRFEEGNCRTLCMACHYYITFKRRIPAGIIWGHNLSKRKTS